jgi:hypothetical protein
MMMTTTPTALVCESGAKDFGGGRVLGSGGKHRAPSLSPAGHLEWIPARTGQKVLLNHTVSTNSDKLRCISAFHALQVLRAVPPLRFRKVKTLRDIHLLTMHGSLQVFVPRLFEVMPDECEREADDDLVVRALGSQRSVDMWRTFVANQLEDVASGSEPCFLPSEGKVVRLIPVEQTLRTQVCNTIRTPDGTLREMPAAIHHWTNMIRHEMQRATQRALVGSLPAAAAAAKTYVSSLTLSACCIPIMPSAARVHHIAALWLDQSFCGHGPRNIKCLLVESHAGSSTPMRPCDRDAVLLNDIEDDEERGAAAPLSFGKEGRCVFCHHHLRSTGVLEELRVARLTRVMQNGSASCTVFGDRP